MNKVFAAVKSFLAAVPGSLKGHLNSAELIRIGVTALTSGGGVLGLLVALQGAVGTLAPAPDAALASAVLTVLVEVARRLQHGAPAPAAE